MSRHSKWANIKRRKEVVDQKRGKVFTKLGRAITIAARRGADPASNITLRLALEKARAANMSKETIERAITRGADPAPGTSLEETLYEAFGSGGLALLIEGTTDNKNRTTGEVKLALEQHGASIGTPGTALWMFERKGLITLATPALTDEHELALIEAGAEDIEEDDGKIIIVSDATSLEKLKEVIDTATLPMEEAELVWIPKEPLHLSPDAEEKLHALTDTLDALDDVTRVTTNTAPSLPYTSKVSPHFNKVADRTLC